MSNEFASAQYTAGQLNAMVKKLIEAGGKDGPNKFLRGELTVSERKPQLDTIIRVDHSVPPSYPDWVETVMHPELENTGPAEYDISTVEQWLHDEQKGGKCIEGNEIYAHLKKIDTLKACLGLRDLEEIQKKGIAFFRKHFQNKAVFGWKGVVRDRFGDLDAPYLCDVGDEVVLGWRWLDDDWLGRGPALRLASSAKT